MHQKSLAHTSERHSKKKENYTISRKGTAPDDNLPTLEPPAPEKRRTQLFKSKRISISKSTKSNYKEKETLNLNTQITSK